MNIHWFKFLFALVLFVQSCSSNSKKVGEIEEVKKGLEVEYLQSYSKEHGALGDIIEYDLMQSYQGKVLVNTFSIPDYRARAIITEPEFEGDYMEVLKSLAIDDSVSVKVSLENLPEQHIPPGLDGQKGTLDFVILVRDIWNEENLIDEMVDRLSDGNPDVWTNTGRGVRVFWDLKGQGKKVEFGDSIRIHVKGLFPNGSVFMNTIDKGPISFLVGEGKVVPQAWEDACTLVNEGDKLTVISPHDMAFGAIDRKPILKYSILVFEIDVVEIIKPY